MVVLYTVMPWEAIWATGQEPLAVVAFSGRLLLVRPRGAFAEVVALLSTDPQDYLNPRWYPGALVPLASHPGEPARST